MASTYSTSLKLELIGNGDQSGTWGTTTNNNFGNLVEQAITGVQTITMINADYTLSNYNGAVDEARNAVLIVTGTNSAIKNIIAPAVEKVYIINNQTSGGYAVNIKTPSSTGINIANGTTATVYCDGAEFYFVTIGATSANTANTVVLRDGAGNFAATAITATTFSGQLSGTISSATTATTQAPGDNSTKVATTAFVTNVAGSLGTMSTQNANAVAVTGGTIDNVTTSGSTTAAAAGLGYLGIPQDAQSTGYTLALSDAGKHIYYTGGAATLTIPTNASIAFPVGSTITIINNGSGNLTIGTTSLTVYWAGTAFTGNRTLATKGLATVMKVATDTWFISGVGLT